MKKLISLIVCVLLALLPALALAELPGEAPAEELPDVEVTLEPETDPEAQPESDPESESDPGADDAPAHDFSTGDTLEIFIDGERVVLDFDASAQYSTIANGTVQASFYRYSEDGTRLFVLYLVFPDTAQPGMCITPDYCAQTGEESSVALIVSDSRTQEEQYYFTTPMGDGVYPEGSNFVIAIDDIQEVDDAITYTGTLSATLVALDMTTGETAATLVIDETPFHFTIGGFSERDAVPLPTEAPNDMRKT